MYSPSGAKVVYLTQADADRMKKDCGFSEDPPKKSAKVPAKTKEVKTNGN